MNVYLNIAELLGSLDVAALEADYRDPSASWLYTRFPDWDKDPLTAELLVLNHYDEEQGYNPDSEDCPAQAAERAMGGLLEYATFEDILAVQFRQNARSATKDYVRAIIHYCEHDSFLT